MIANADPFRGDIVTVEKKVFPRSARAIQQDVRERAANNQDAEKEEPQVELLEPVTNQQENAEPEKNMFLGIDWNNPQHLIYVIAILGILFLIAVLFALLRKPSKEMKNIECLQCKGMKE